jgi:diguanylate cyclase (GGDEF)-like protein
MDLLKRLLLLLCLLSGSVYGQIDFDARLIELKELAKTNPASAREQLYQIKSFDFEELSPTQQSLLFYQLAQLESVFGDSVLALSYTESAVKIPTIPNELQTEIMLLHAYLKDLNGESNAAIDIAIAQLSKAKLIENKVLTISAHLVLANLYLFNSMESQALSELEAAFQKLKDNQTAELSAFWEYSMARNNAYFNEQKQALAGYENALKLYRAQNNKVQELLVEYELAEVHFNYGEDEQAIAMFNKVHQLAIHLKLESYQFLALGGLAKTYMFKQQFDTSQALFLEAEALLPRLTDKYASVQFYMYWLQLTHNQGDSEGTETLLIKVSELILGLTPSMNPQLFLAYYDNLAKHLVGKKDFENAYYALDDYRKVLLQQTQRDNAQAIAKYKSAFEVERESHKNELLQKKVQIDSQALATAALENQRVYLLLALTALLAVCIFVFWYRQLRYSNTLSILANSDPLTQLANRRFAISRSEVFFNDAKKHMHPMSLVIFDLDHFKQINDKFGHLVGDKVLVEVAAVLKKLIRNDDVVARIGGEEFLICWCKQDIASALVRCEELRSALVGLEIIENGERVPVSASFGVAELNAQDDTLDSLISRADHALYQAKENGRNQVCKAS